MTDRDLAAQAWNELTQTTITYARWKAQGFTAGHWANAKKALDQIGQPAPSAGLRVGITNNVGGGGSKDHVLQLGAKLIREDTPSADTLSWAHANGIQVVGIVYGDPAQMGADVIEGDNEPYNSGSWNITTWAAAMLKVAQAAHAAGKPFLLSVGPPWNNGNVNVGGQWVDCVQAINDAQPSIWQYVAGVSVHPYSQPAPPVPGRFPVLDKWRTTLRNIGHGEISFWVTEVGWPTGGNTWPGTDTSEQTQADYFATWFDQAATRTDIAVAIPYRLDDYGPRDSDSEHWFGLIRPDGSLKPAYAVVKAHV